MIQSWKVLSTAALVAALSAGMAIPAFAADGDMVNTSTGTTYLASNYKTDTAAFNALIDQLILDSSHFSYEFTTGGTPQLFNFVDYSNKVAENIAKGESVATAKADAAVTLSVATVKSVSAITGTTVAGTAFALPATVSATMSDATTKQVAVTWDAVAPASYATAGSYTVSGTIAGTTVKASATVTVTAAIPTTLGVASVSAINATTLQVVLAATPVADYTVADASEFQVNVNGTAVAAPTAVTKVASDLTGKTYKLTVATLNGQQGDVAVNGTTAPVAIGKTFAFDYKAPEVLGIVVQDSKHIVVNFSEQINANSVVANRFQLASLTAPIQNAAAAVLNADKKSVTLTLTTALVPADYVLSLGETTNKVEDVAGNGIYVGTQVSFRPTATDLISNTPASLTKASYNTGAGTLTLTFDRAITDSLLDTTKLSVNGVALTVADTNTEATPDDNAVVITLSAASKTAVNALTGALTFTSAEGAYGTATAMTKGETFAIAKEQPSVISSSTYDQSSNVLTVTFDQAVKLNTANVLSVDTDANAGDAVVVTKAMAVGDNTATQATWSFNLGTTGAILETLAPAPTSDSLKVFIAAGAVTNAADISNLTNQNAYATGVKTTYTADVTKPTLASTQYNDANKQLTLTFSENVSATLANITAAKIAVQSATGTDVTTLSGLTQGDIAEGVGTSNKTITVNLNSDLVAASAALEAAYNQGMSLKVVLKDVAVKDEAALQNVSTTYATGVALVYNDYTKPTVADLNVNNKNHVTVNFSESMDKATAENIANYVIKDGANNVLAVTGAALQADKQSVVLTTPDQVANKPYYVTISNVKDVALNVMNTDATWMFNGSAAAGDAKLTLTSLTATTVANSNNDTLVLQLSAPVDSSSISSLANYSVLAKGALNDYSDATAVSLNGATVGVVPNHPDQVQITLAGANLQTSKEYKVIVQNLKDSYGNALDTTAASATGTATGDASINAPTVSELQIDGANNDKVTLVFNEELDSASASNKASYTVDANADGTNDVTSAQYVWDATAKKATVTLTLSKDFTVPTDVVVKKEVLDLAGNSLTMPAADTTIVAASTTLKDATKPTVDTVIAKANPSAINDTMIITFKDKDILGASAEQSANYIVKDASGNVIPSLDYSVTFNEGDLAADSVTLLFNGAADKAYNLQNGVGYTVAISGALDVSGNAIDSVTKTVTWDTNSDTAAPTLNAAITSISAATKTFTVTYAEDADATTAANKANYTVVYSANGLFTDNVTLSPIFASYSADIATVVVSDTVNTIPGVSKYKITVKNVKDLAGNVQTAGSSATLAN